MVKKWPNYGKKLFSGPKKGPNSGFWPKIFFWPNWSKNGQNMAKSCFPGLKRVQIVVFGPKYFWPNWSKNGRNMVNNCFLGLKRVQIVVFGVEKCFGQIGQKMAKIWLKDPFLVNCPLNIDF